MAMSKKSLFDEAEIDLSIVCKAMGHPARIKIIKIDKNFTEINISGEDVEKLGVGAKDLKIFAISDSVLKPDYYSTSFLIVENKAQLPQITQTDIDWASFDYFMSRSRWCCLAAPLS